MEFLKLNDMLISFCWKTVPVKLLLDFILLSFIYVRTAGVKVIGHDTTAIYGENATLLCQLTDTDESVTRIIWKRKIQDKPAEVFLGIRPGDKTELKNGLGDRVQFIGKFAEKDGTIQLLRMSFWDEGIYTCVFNLFPSGTYETDINVTVLAHPVVNVKGETPVTGRSEATIASCFASNGRPAPAVTWRLGDLENSLRTETNRTVHPNGTITVVSYLLGVPFKHLNKKNIQCVITHNTLREDLVLNYTINIHYPPESVIIIPDSQTNAKEFKCIVDSNPEPTNYTWTRGHKSVPYEGNKLRVPNLSPDFNGFYVCQASNQYGSSSGSLYVNVHTGNGFERSCVPVMVKQQHVPVMQQQHNVPMMMLKHRTVQDSKQDGKLAAMNRMNRLVSRNVNRELSD